jgi:hypothetical protein
MGPTEVSAAGTALIFLSVLVGTGLLTLIVFTYAAYCLLVILTHTAAGDDEFRWPGDSIQDVFWIFWYFLWLVGIWAGPASLVLRPVALTLPWHLGCLVAISWLVFPLSLLSSLSSTTRWVVLQPRIFPALFKHGKLLFRFYLVTGSGLAIAFLAFYGAVMGPLILWPVAAVYGGISFFIYARLLGRLGWLISWHAPNTKEQSEDQKTPEKAQELLDFWPEEHRKKTPSRARGDSPKAFLSVNNTPVPEPKIARVEVTDPWAIPSDQPPAAPLPRKTIKVEQEEFEDPLGPARGTYGVRSDNQPWRKSDANISEKDQEIFALKPALTETPPPPSETPDIADDELETKRAQRISERPAPEDPLATRVYAFPFYGLSLRPLLTLIAGLFGVAGALRVLVSVWPDFLE